MISTNTGIQNRTISFQKYEEELNLGQVAKGFAGAAIGAVIDSVGATASSIVHLPKALYSAYKTTWKTKAIGPVLKTAISALLPVGALLVPPLTAIGGLGWGMASGFGNASHEGLSSAIEESIENVEDFHTEQAPKFYEILKAAENAMPAEGEKPYDIKIIEAGKGLVGAAAGAIIEGPSVGVITAARVPKGLSMIFKLINKQESVGPVAKKAVSLVIYLLSLLAPPLTSIGGAVYGMAAGFKDAYKEGITQSMKNRIEDLKKWDDVTREMANGDFS